MKFTIIASLLLLLTSSYIIYKAPQQGPKEFKIGDKAPLFESTDQAGKSYKLANALKKGPVVLFFYRGQWCPYCNKYMSAIQDSLQLIVKKGATVVGISPELPENVTQPVAKTKAAFLLISDKNNKICSLYNVAYKPDTAMLKAYKNYGIDLVKSNGNDSEMLPVPATYVIGKDGKIKFVHFDKDYRNRPRVADILKAL